MTIHASLQQRAAARLHAAGASLNRIATTRQLPAIAVDPYKVGGIVAAGLATLGLLVLLSGDPGGGAFYVATATLVLALAAWREARK